MGVAAPEETEGLAQPATLRALRSRGRARGIVALLGPAFVAAVAYVDPGNFATNFTAGASFGYALAWTVVLANLMAMLVQYLSAKTGVATERDLPELCREHFGARVSVGLWVQAELIAMATDLAEFVGAAIGLNVLLGFAYDLAEVGASPRGIAAGLVPGLASDRLLLISGIIGATVMPHVVYLHSALTKSRVTCDGDAERREVLRFQRLDVVVALGAAGLVNLAMLFVAASVFHRTGGSAINSLEAAHAGLARLVGGGAALAFAVALLASGLSSSSVGTYAGQVVMQGFIRRRIPLWARRALTMLPALVVLGLGLPPTDCLVISQVVLSFGIPFALVPLVLLTRRADIMGALVNRRLTTVVAGGIAVVIIALNLYLLWATFGT